MATPQEARLLMKQLDENHIKAAVARIDAGDMGGFAESTKYDLFWNGKRYPPKRVIGLALKEMSGLTFDPYDFKGGEASNCFKTLQRLDFDVVDKSGKHFPKRNQNALLSALENAEAKGEFDASNAKDAREKVMRSIALRQGQPKFRRALLAAYSGKCAVTRCDVEDALEAAHIIPYKGAHTNSVRNGLLLRADIHTLFDMGLFRVDPTTLKVVIAPQLASGSYSSLAGIKLHIPQRNSLQPDREALKIHGEASLA